MPDDAANRSQASTDPAEFARLLRADQARLFGYIHSLVRDSNDADDLFQQTAMVLWRKFAEYDPARPFFGWACGVARFEVTNFLRTRGRSKLYFSDDLNLLLIEAHERLASDDVEARREALSGCVGKLRERDRELVMTCYGDDGAARRVSDVAGGQGRSSQSVHNSLRRIRRALFECIQRTLRQEGHPPAEGVPS
ncbi:MAG TPA: sigma-70 family RNA polymerase sigma factor [Tepidisphaeraceae bacterium]|nr:sigma-70 family RNA polymerase sigma factor [Tepidisphaeraceae bacterium]